MDTTRMVFEVSILRSLMESVTTLPVSATAYQPGAVMIVAWLLEYGNLLLSCRLHGQLDGSGSAQSFAKTT